MSWILFTILCAQTGGVIVWALLRAERINYFSSLFALTFVGFALPQLFGLLRGSETFPSGALVKTLLMANLCFACLILGFRVNAKPSKRFLWSYTPKGLLFISSFLTVVGGACYFKITRLPDDVLNMGQWSGIVTIYNFFASALPCGFVVALYLALKRPSAPILVILAFCSVLILDRAVMDGRRSQAVMLLLSVALALWMFKGKTIPRYLFIVSAIAGYFVVYSIADYRRAIIGEGKSFNSIFLGGGLSGFKNLSDIHFLENAGNVAKEGSTEYEAAVFGIAAADENMRFDFGLSHWNALVHHFVPAQFLGQDFKESLKFNLGQTSGSSGYEKLGSTSEPGIVDAFRSFWFFGCVKFFLIGLLMRMLLVSGLAGNINLALFYIILAPSSIIIVSHPIDFFIENIIHSALLFGAAVLMLKLFYPSAIIEGKASYSRRRRQTAKPPRFSLPRYRPIRPALGSHH